MALFRGFARKDATRGTNPVEIRKGQAGLFTPSAVGSVGLRAGILPTGAWQLVAGDSGWRYAVGAFHAVTSRGPSDGAMLFGNDGLVYVGTNGAGDTVPPAPGSGLSRIDIVWVRHPTAGENSDTSSEPIFGVASGTPLSVPVAPTIPTGAMELARNTMTSSATSTNSTGNSIAQTFPWAALRGTPVKVRSQAELDVLTPLASAYDPGRAYRIDTQQDMVNYGTGWRLLGDGAGVYSAEGVRSTTDSFAGGSFVPSGAAATIVGAPAGVYLITYTLIVSSTAGSIAYLRGRVGGGNATGDIAFSLISGTRTPLTLTRRYVHTGGDLVTDVQVQVSAGTGTVYPGTSVTAARVGSA